MAKLSFTLVKDEYEIHDLEDDGELVGWAGAVKGKMYADFIDGFSFDVLRAQDLADFLKSKEHK